MSVVQGACAPQFQAVKDEFEKNFAERGELGASVCISVKGETVLDLWGGVADKASGKPWGGRHGGVRVFLHQGTNRAGRPYADRPG